MQATAVGAQNTDARWTLKGTKPWCSLAGQLDHALITAHTTSGNRRLFAIGIRDDGVSVQSGGWVARGLAGVKSGPISLDVVLAIPIGADDWYLERPSFSWAGIGVAASWFGASVAPARRLHTALRIREPDQIWLMVLGNVDLELNQCRTVLAAASTEVDRGSTIRPRARPRSTRYGCGSCQASRRLRVVYPAGSRRAGPSQARHSDSRS